MSGRLRVDIGIAVKSISVNMDGRGYGSGKKVCGLLFADFILYIYIICLCSAVFLF